LTGADNYLAHLQELTQLSEQAQAATRDQDWDSLLACLAQRQLVMDQIDALPDSERVLPPAQREQAAGLLQRAVELNAAAAATVDTALLTTRSALQDSSWTRSSIGAYRRSAKGSPQMIEARFVDKNR
jgi:hypothetical protein